MKPASLFLLHLILLVCINWFGSLNSASDNYKISGEEISCSSDQYSHNKNVVLEKALYKNNDFIAPSKYENRFRIVRKTIFCVYPQLNTLRLFFQFYSPTTYQRTGVAAACLTVFPLRI